MSDRLISFKTSILLKEKGFREKTWWRYLYENNEKEGIASKGSSPENWNLTFWSEERIKYAARPTQSTVQKYLREKNIVVLVEIVKYQDEYVSRIINYQEPFTNPKFSETYDKYENALEEGLVIGLEILKN